MPHSGYTICTSEQRPTSTTVSHGFVVERYSSPPFGSQGPCKHSKPCPLDFGSGHSMQRYHSPSGNGRCLHHASERFRVSAIQQASSLDSLVRVSRRAESSTARKCQAPLPFLTGAKLGGGAAKHGDHHQDGAVPSVAKHTPSRSTTSDRHVRRHTGFEDKQQSIKHSMDGWVTTVLSLSACGCHHPIHGLLRIQSHITTC